MSLANAYASVIKETPTELHTAEFVGKLLSFMRVRGHLSLLSEVVRILEKEPTRSGVVVTVADDAGLKEFASEIKSALGTLGADTKSYRTTIDARAVGGYSVRAGSKIIDNTFRTALVSLYQRTVSST
ncbi:MAG: F0F1 ATP synthase subunit delta [Patescibacteria group bacterium]